MWYSHRQYDYGGRRGVCEVRERALGVMLTWRGQAWAPSPTRISRRRTPRWCAPTSTPTDVTRPATRPGSLLGHPSINRWAPADQRTENTASQPPDAPSQDRSGVLHGNCSRHDRFGSRTAQLRARRSSYVAQASAVQLRWTQRCVRGAGASSGCYVTRRGQARAPSPTRISCRRTPRRHTPISTPTGATRPVAGRVPSLGPPSTNRWAPADQRTENIAAAEG